MKKDKWFLNGGRGSGRTYRVLFEYYENKVANLEKENAKAKDLLKWFVWYFREGSPNLVPYKHKVEEAEQFLKDLEK